MFGRRVRLVLAALLFGAGPIVIGVPAAHALAAAGNYVVNTGADATDATPGDGVCANTGDAAHCSLRAAVQEADADAAGSNITFATSVTLVTLTIDVDVNTLDDITTGDINITNGMTITGNGANTTIVNGGMTSDTTGVRIFKVESGNVTISDLGLTAGNAERNGSNPPIADGGCLLSTSTSVLTLTRVTATNCLGDNGGGVAAEGAGFTGTGLTMGGAGSGQGSRALQSGGGLATKLLGGSTASVTNSSIVGNSANGGGGGFVSFAICATAATPLNVDGLTVTGNTATGGGAAGVAVVMQGGTSAATLQHVTVDSNSTANEGAGGILTEVFPDPQQNCSGTPSATFTDTAVTENTANAGPTRTAGDGGGIFMIGGTFNRLLVRGNTAADAGGGVYFFPGGGPNLVENATITGNGASVGGGVAVGAISSTANQLLYSTVTGNTASTAGGGLATEEATDTLILGGNIISANTPQNCSFFAGSTIMSARNIEDGTSCALTGTGDLSSTNPNLGPLTGTGSQLHFPLLSTSLAIDHVPVSSTLPLCGTPPTDQIGTTRPFGNGCDSGAIEFVPPPCDHTVTGNVAGNVSANGGRWCVNNASIGGNILVGSGTTLTVTNSSTTGGISGSNPAAVTVCGSRIGGAVSISGASGFVLLGDPDDDSCAGNTLAGVTLSSNHAGLELVRNTRIGGNVSLTNNTNGAELEANPISGSVYCSGNSPAPTNNMHPNNVSGTRSGQCASI